MDLEQRIRRLEDLEAIRMIKYKYFISLDKACWDDVVACFTEDAVVDVGLGTLNGHAEIAQMFRDVYVNTFEWWSHQSSNPVIELTSERTAKGTWELEGFVVTQPPVTGMWTAVFYEDLYAKRDDGWRISKSTVVPIFRCDIEQGFARQRMIGLPDQ